MKKYVNLLSLSRNVLQNTFRNEVNPLPRIVLKKYSTNAEQSNKTTENINENVNILPMNDKNITEDDDIFLKDLVNNIKIPRALEECDEDLSELGPYYRPSFNFAAYANKSETIQELVKLGVELYKIEAKPKAMETILSSKFEDLKPYIQFLHDCGVPAEEIGPFITKNPLIFTDDMDDLRTRIRYLRAHNFSKSDISRIVTENPYWLSWSTTEIDHKLAYFQREFGLRGREVRDLVVKRPQLITHKLKNIRDNTFSIREEMGFDEDQLKNILLSKPHLWERVRGAMLKSFNYVHLEMGISHEVIAKQPSIISTRVERIKQRHLFLVSLKRAQYDPKKPLYVPLDAFAMYSDIDFCVKFAKSSIELYDMFLKTL